MDKDLISLDSLTKEDVLSIIDLAKHIKANPDEYSKILDQKTLAMIFEKPSLRTRMSFETGMTKMGGHAIFLSKEDIQLGHGESIEDTATVTSRFADIILARLFEHKTIEVLAENSSVPVINALTNYNHPCQILADLLTISEKRGCIDNLKLAFLGDCTNNTCNSFILIAPIIGMEVRCAFPEGYGPSEDVLNKAKGHCVLTQDAKEAVKDADIVCTDTWMSMHIPEDQKAKRMEELDPYRVTTEIMNSAKEDSIFMHCLPAHRGEEVAADVIDGPKSVVFDEAENRMWAQNAIMLKLLKLK